jgi:hypothetical protein
MQGVTISEPTMTLKAALHGFVASWACAWLLSGCATQVPAQALEPPPGMFEDSAFGAPTHAPDARGVFALSPAMKTTSSATLPARSARSGASAPWSMPCRCALSCISNTTPS